MGILLFVLKYMFISLLLKMINGFSWSANIIASPFNLSRNLVLLILYLMKIRKIKYPRKFKFYIDSKTSRFAKLSTCKNDSNLKLSPCKI